MTLQTKNTNASEEKTKKKKMIGGKMTNLQWKCISHFEERGVENELLYSETTMEAEYRHGWLIKEIFIMYEEVDNACGKHHESITFVPGIKRGQHD